MALYSDRITSLFFGILILSNTDSVKFAQTLSSLLALRNTLARVVVLYGGDTWTSTKIIATAQNIRDGVIQKYKIVRRIEGCSREDQMSNKTKEWTDRETDRVVSAKI